MPAPPDRKALIAKAKAVARRLGRESVTQTELRRLGRVTQYRIRRCFDSYAELLEEAGLSQRAPSERLSEDELMRAMAEAFRKTSGIASYMRFSKACRHSATAYTRRWGSWPATLLAFSEWQPEHDPEFPHAGELAAANQRRGRNRLVWAPLGRRRYGETLNFRGLLHAPVNEQGVIFLFATLAVDLGFLIESLTLEFPDCEAKRRVGRGWERVRIEFEYQSRNFREHRHDPKGCDLVVCWEHNWPECPIEVLELKPLVMERAPFETRLKTAAPQGEAKRTKPHPEVRATASLEG